MTRDRLAPRKSPAAPPSTRPEPLTPDRIITEKSIENAFRVLLAIGGSTNAIIHLTAIAGRLGIQIDLARLNAISAKRRCWSTSSRPASITWKTSTRPAAWPRCCVN